MALTRLVKELAPELRDVGNMNAGMLANARLPNRLQDQMALNVSSDLNNAVATGYYGQSDTTLNKSPLNYAIVHVEVWSADWITQTATWTFATGTDVLRWRRHRHSGTTWGPWYQLADHKAGWLGTVSQSGGVPTGAIIERGSNGNGHYFKMADGTLQCQGYATHSTTQAGIWSTFTWTHPHAFVNAVHSWASIAAPVSNQAIMVGASTGFSSTVVYLRSDSPVSNQGINLLAMGRWF